MHAEETAEQEKQRLLPEKPVEKEVVEKEVVERVSVARIMELLPSVSSSTTSPSVESNISSIAEHVYYPLSVGHSSNNVRDFRLPRNETKTTKYSFAMFLPRFLFEQYKRATNVCSLNQQTSPYIIKQTTNKRTSMNFCGRWEFPDLLFDRGDDQLDAWRACCESNHDASASHLRAFCECIPRDR